MIDISYEVTIDTLTSQSSMPCNPIMDKGEDECIYRKIVQELVREFGCSMPYLPRLGDEQICEPNGVVELNATRKFLTLMKTQLRAMCSRPCATFEVYSGMPFFSQTGTSLSHVKMYLKTSTKIKEIVPDYTSREMVADIGGYTGLLLGVSLVRINWILDKFFEKLIG